jgi:phosphatidylserine/phosphatidylglycerophosphate/cardiolipin synthase-like enzyme
LYDLTRGLRCGHFALGVSSFMIRHLVAGVTEDAAAELAALLSTGFAPEHAALLIDTVAAERPPRVGLADIELVTSGPDAVGATRDTGVVLRQLFTSAERRVLIVGFAVHEGREIFVVLSKRMTHRSGLVVQLCLDIRRAPGDKTKSNALQRRFAERFVRQEWPGAQLPELFFDPRSLAESEAQRASLHAKCVVVDGVRALIGSADLTEAAQLRNIEVGIIVRGAIAEALERHFHALIAGGHLRPLPLEGPT